MNWPISFTGTFTGAVYTICIAAGWTGVLMEFVRPGWVLPGACGGVLLIYGLARALPEHLEIAIATSAPFLVAAAWMLDMARRARRNKRAL